MTTAQLLQAAIVFAAVVLAGLLGYLLGRGQGRVSVENGTDVLTTELSRMRRRAVSREDEMSRLRAEIDRQRRRNRRG